MSKLERLKACKDHYNIKLMVPQLDLHQREFKVACRILESVSQLEKKLGNLQNFYDNTTLYSHPRGFQKTVKRNAKIPAMILTLYGRIKDGIVDFEIAKLQYDEEAISR